MKGVCYIIVMCVIKDRAFPLVSGKALLFLCYVALLVGGDTLMFLNKGA